MASTEYASVEAYFVAKRARQPSSLSGGPDGAGPTGGVGPEGCADRRTGAVHHIRGGGLRRDGGDGTQRNRARQGDPGSLLCERPGHGGAVGGPVRQLRSLARSVS